MALKGVNIHCDARGYPSKATFDLKKHPHVEDYLDHLMMEKEKKGPFIPYVEVDKEIKLKFEIKNK